MVVALMTNVLVWAEANVRLDLLTDLKVIVPTGVVIALEFAVTVSHAVDVVVQLLIDTLTDIIIGVLLADVIVNVFAAVVLIVLDFTMSTPLEEFNC